MRKSLSALGSALWIALLFSAASGKADDSLAIPAGSSLDVRLTTTLSTRTSQEGDLWTGKVVDPIFAKGQEIVPAGSTVEGHVTFVKQPGRVKGRGEMRLLVDSISTMEGVSFNTAAGLENVQGAEGTKVEGEEGTIKGPSSTKSDAKTVGIGAGVGAGVGAIAAGGKGSLYGAGIGAAAAAVRGLLKRGKDIVLPQGSELTFIIPRDVPGKKAGSPAEASPR